MMARNWDGDAPSVPIRTSIADAAEAIPESVRQTSVSLMKSLRVSKEFRRVRLKL